MRGERNASALNRENGERNRKDNRKKVINIK